MNNLNTELDELFGNSKEDAKKEMRLEDAARQLLEKPRTQGILNDVLLKGIIDVLASSSIIDKIKTDKKRHLGYILYVLFTANAKHGSLLKYGAKDILKHKDPEIKKGAEIAQKNLEELIK